ncbi:hypothetical protein PENTCL1PPCAC_17207, partial [Pristionchus entomophagus]
VDWLFPVCRDIMSDCGLEKGNDQLPIENPLASDKDQFVPVVDGCGDGGKPFPFLLLPVELIAFILHLLPLADRLRSRVNRMLFELEADEHYWMKELVVECSDRSHRFSVDHRTGLRINLSGGPRSDHVAALAKLASNVAIESLAFNCATPADRVLIPQIKSFSCEQLRVAVTGDDSVDGEEISDGNLEGWIGDRKFVTLHSEGGALT